MARRRPPEFLPLLAAVFLLPLAAARASDAPADGIPLGLYLNHSFYGHIPASLEAEEPALLRSDLLPLVRDMLDPPVFSRVFPAGEPDTAWIPLGRLRDAGLEARFDFNLLEVTLVVPPELRKMRDVRVLKTQERSVEGAEKPAVVSGYLNLYGRGEYAYRNTDEGGSTSELPLSLMAEPVLNIMGYVAEGEIFFQTRPENDVGVDYARLVRDIPSANMRLSLGSLVFPPEAMFASPARLAGGAVVRDPDLAFNRPASFSSRKEIFLQNPAAITVYVNGQAAANFRLDAGRHTLGSFPFQTGLNDVRIEIREEGRPPRFEEYSVAFDSDLLAEDEFTYFAGVGTRQWTAEDPLATAFYRRGVRERLTLGLHLQAAPDAGIGGLESILASPFGSLKGTAGFSAGDGRNPDFAAGLQYRFSTAGRRLYPVVGLGARYTGKYHLAPETALRENPYSWTLEASASQYLPFRAGVNLSFAYRTGRDGADDLASGTFGISKSFDDGFALNFTFGADSRAAGGVTFRGGVFLTSVPPRGRSSFHLSGDLKGSAAADLQVRPKKYIGSPGFSAAVGGLPFREDAAAYARAGAQLNHELFETSLSDTLSRGANGSPEAANSLSWSLSSSVAFADGLWGVSRPIRDGFAIVAPGKSLADKEILVNHGADFRLRSARQKRPVILPNLQAYTTGTVHLNVPELPLEQQAEVFRRLLAPVYRTGYALVMETRPRVFGGGRLVYGDGTPVALQAGEVYAPGDGNFESMIFYSDETGAFQFYDLVPGTYGVRMYMSRNAVQEFVIPGGAEGLFDIGNIRIPGTPP